MAYNFPALLAQLTDAQLLELGKRGARTDFAVRFFHDQRHPKFYRHRPSLLRAARRATEVNFPDTKAAMRQRVMEMLDLDRPDAHRGGESGCPAALESAVSED
jgi:hypothetical protein